MSDEQEGIYQQAIAWLERSSLKETLKASAIALVPAMPTRLEGMPYCRGCESVLCGACGQCHSLDLAPPDLCPADEDTMGGDCAAWFQAFNAVITIARQQEEVS